MRALWGSMAFGPQTHPNYKRIGWRSNHVVTLITKAITARFYGMPIKYSYMVGNSKGGQAVLLEARRLPKTSTD